MAPAQAAAATAGRRRARHVDNSEKNDSDSDLESPRPQKLRKRLSEAHLPESQQEGSSIAENGQRVPLKSVNINDDEAEKRRRRKSAKITVLDNAVAGPSSEGGANGDADGARPGQSRRQQPLNAVAAAPTPKPSFDIMSSNFEEWMKMATDNKINATNSWEFALIDYFHDMSLLRNSDDNSINFQRASCTLDGCVKIWTSRVDSVGTETGKLLSNLASGGKDDDGDDDSDNPDADPSQPKKKKAASRPTNTLVKDYSVLTNKKLDLEFSVDPLFKKTCADFDEGGASGLLLNHLSLGLGGDGGMRVIFDASDSVFKEEADVPDEPEDLADISELRAKFIPDFSVLDDKVISHSLTGFSFNRPFDPNGDSMPTEYTQFNPNAIHDDDESDNEPDTNNFGSMDVDEGPTEDFFAGPEAINDDFGYGGGGGDDYGGDGEGGSAEPEAGEGQMGGGGARTGPFVPFDPRNAPNGRELVLGMADPDGEGGGLDYFDSRFLKNWAGPEHWKLRRTIRKPVQTDDGDGGGKTAGKSKKKEPEKIDFLTPPEKDLKITAKELFAPPGKGQSINLAGTGVGSKRGKKKKDKKDEHLLPDDMHFSSKQLVTLFLKPKFFLKMRGKKARVDGDSGEIDNEFWAQAAAGARNADDDMDGDGNNPDIPFNTQFFNDDFDDGFDGEGVTIGPSALDVDAGEQDLLAATSGETRRVKPEFVNYAKKAKRVDVRRLKENIWKGLDIIVLDDDEEGDMDVDSQDPTSRRRSKSQKPPTDPAEARQFSQVINGLQKSYPRDKLEEISTSFCFICLLHLANEQGLKLETSSTKAAAEDDNNADLRRGRSQMRAMEEDEDEEVRDTIIPDDEDDLIAAGGMKDATDERTIGDIWGIKIYRDPNATRSA
ncbi:hypothetical protein EST38_g1944 [Candolleomyces aberdarensis]|uniref:Condensin complex subunit 2 n=1 Tax=Candolleomyces aberdarensis TaxID=2316362 RepID=A0A4Q2DY02_9AGAR|nr:hypothetical protein EST38_g1944 [Candolleomyces aberdarensis]